MSFCKSYYLRCLHDYHNCLVTRANDCSQRNENCKQNFQQPLIQVVHSSWYPFLGDIKKGVIMFPIALKVKKIVTKVLVSAAANVQLVFNLLLTITLEHAWKVSRTSSLITTVYIYFQSQNCIYNAPCLNLYENHWIFFR